MVIWYLWHDVSHWITVTSYDKMTYVCLHFERWHKVWWRSSPIGYTYFHITVYMVICITVVYAWCRMVRPVIPPAQLWHFYKRTEWMFCLSHPVLLTITPSSTFGMWLVGRSGEGVLEISGNYSNLSLMNGTEPHLHISEVGGFCAQSLPGCRHNRHWSINCKSQWNFGCYYDE